MPPASAQVTYFFVDWIVISDYTDSRPAVVQIQRMNFRKSQPNLYLLFFSVTDHTNPARDTLMMMHFCSWKLYVCHMLLLLSSCVSSSQKYKWICNLQDAVFMQQSFAPNSLLMNDIRVLFSHADKKSRAIPAGLQSKKISLFRNRDVAT